MRELEKIRNNLLDATMSLRRMGPYAPKQLIQEVEAAWVRLRDLNRQLPARRRSNNLGIISLIIVGSAIGLASIFGGSWLIGRELNESDRLKKLAECIENATKTGISLEKAQKTCNQLYGKGNGALINVGGMGISTKTLIIIGAVFVGGIILYKKL